MKILVLGGGGMIGAKLAKRIAVEGIDGKKPEKLVLHDIIKPAKPEADFAVETMTGDVAREEEIAKLAHQRFDLIFHLASIVSGEAETDFEKGWETNARGSWRLLEALRAEHEASTGTYRPKVIFSSSIAVFGGPYPELIEDEFLCSPQSSYGAQKAIVELLLQDYSRKGFVDGISMRLPTVCVRPGKANKAASSFFSGIIREPLNGQEAILPVDDSVRHWHASPRSAVGFLLHAATLDTNRLENRRALNLPGFSCTVAEQIEALRKVAGEDPVKLIKRQADEAIIKIVSGWPRNFDPERAIALGFKAESSFEEIIRIYIEEELQNR